MVERTQTMGLDGGGEKALSYKPRVSGRLIKYGTLSRNSLLATFSNSLTHTPQNLPTNVPLHNYHLPHWVKRMIND